jgi:hypothetical protein
MPPNEPCPHCNVVVPDWHYEWHSTGDQDDIKRGTAGMECPFCKGVVLYSRGLTPLKPAPPGGRGAKRDAKKAAIWAKVCNGTSLEDYLKTPEGNPFTDQWSSVEIQQSDLDAASQP